jgi:hypothetical protein
MHSGLVAKSHEREKSGHPSGADAAAMISEENSVAYLTQLVRSLCTSGGILLHKYYWEQKKSGPSTSLS